ncbi:STAS domain-containing protein [Eikenella sp. S3360]|uniref:STAS domain-containing protein n=1 Tax=Eikenella glucosivorans TaxID=2766967 RepID=A0ABS0N9X1_9NEIS|nr:STAS domain-containing protein [Eikenella glucosivorans]MBH5329099.1 STAS domain-containing protein [Eikenella glucosivorans]
MHSECRDGTVYVSGEVTVSTVTAPLFRAYCQQLGYLKNSARPTVDFSGITQADSVCISLLAAAKRSHPEAAWSFAGIPAGVAALAELYEVGDWISS